MKLSWTKMRKLPPSPFQGKKMGLMKNSFFFSSSLLVRRLCLRIFRGLGFLPSKTSTNEETTTTDEWSSIMVRSDTRNTAIQFDIHTAHLKQNKISPLILADQLWKAAE